MPSRSATAASAGAYTVVRTEVKKLDASMPVYAMKTLEGQLDERLMTDRLIASLAAFTISDSLVSPSSLPNFRGRSICCFT